MKGALPVPDGRTLGPSDPRTLGPSDPRTLGPSDPRTLGHESVGVIHRLGSAVTGFEEGQRVVVCAVTPCYRCSYCQRGFTSQCGGALGGYMYTTQMDGNMAEYFVVPAAAANLTPLPDTVSDEQAVYCCDMLTTGSMGVEHSYLQFGRRWPSSRRARSG